MTATAGAISGTIVLLYMGESAVSYSTNCSLTITGAGTIDTTNKDSGYWAQKLKGHGSSWSASVSGMFNIDGSGINPREIHDSLEARETFTLKICTTNASDFFFAGSAVCTSFTLDAPDNDASTFSADFEGLDTLRCTMT